MRRPHDGPERCVRNTPRIIIMGTTAENENTQTEETPVPTSHVAPSTRLAPPASPLGSEPVTFRRCRMLLGWAPEQEAIHALLGRGPTPTDDLVELVARARQYRDAVHARPEYVESDALIDRDDPVLAEIAARPEVAAEFAGHQWRPAIVDLRKVIAFQKVISLEGHGERVASARPDDLRSLAELCVPPSQPDPPAGALSDGDGKGVTVSSVNPNLRLVATNISGANVARGGNLPPLKAQAVTFFVTMGSSYLTAARYKGRIFLRDGYHRATALLNKGVTAVPCIFIEARTFEEVAAPGGGFLSYETVFGTHPPLLPDFWDAAVAAEVRQIELRKVIRIRGDEFPVQR